MSSYKELVVWQKSFSLALDVYRITGTFPDSERFALQSQMRRAGVSIPSNIAEGSKRGTNKDFSSFLRIAHGSAAELETQLLLAKELHYISEQHHKESEEKLSEVMKMLSALLQSLH